MFTNNHLRIVQEGVSIFLLLHVSKWSICIYIRIYFVLQIRLMRQRVSLRTIVISLTEKAMAPHSSTFTWKIPWTEEPGGLQSMRSWMRSRRVCYDWATSLSLFTFLHWRRKWQPTPVFLPGESQGQWNLVGCRLRGYTKSDMTEGLSSSSSSRSH